MQGQQFQNMRTVFKTEMESNFFTQKVANLWNSLYQMGMFIDERRLGIKGTKSVGIMLQDYSDEEAHHHPDAGRGSVLLQMLLLRKNDTMGGRQAGEDERRPVHQGV